MHKRFRTSKEQTEDCPRFAARFKDGDKLKEIQLRLSLTRMLFYNGICCKVVKPKEADVYVLSYIYHSMNYSNFRNVTTGFNMILSDHQTAMLVQPQKFTKKGPPLKSSTQQLGYVGFRIKILEEVHHEDHFPCRKYNEIGGYNHSLEKEYTRKSLEVLYCTPPWKTDNQSFWCGQHLDLSKELNYKAFFLLGKLQHNCS